MKKLIAEFSCSTLGYGYDEVVAYAADDSATEEEIYLDLLEQAKAYFESYADVLENDPQVTEDFEEGPGVYSEGPGRYILVEDIEVYWEEYRPEIHDSLRSGGGSFEEDF